MIKWLFIIVLIGSLPTIAFSATSIFFLLSANHIHLVLSDTLRIFILINITGLGMFGANAIQFGIDQMLETSSQQLSSFVH